MDDEEVPFDSNSSDIEDLKEKKILKAMKEHEKIMKKMSKFEKKLMRGLMRGFANTMILWLISQKKQHGYEIMTKLHQSSPYENKMPSASKIYPVLHDLEKNGLIKGFWENHGKRKVKYYEITPEGEETLSRFKDMAQIARENKSSLWLEFMRDMMAYKDNGDNRS